MGAVKPAHDAEIDRDEVAVLVDEDVAGVHVAVEEAVPEHLLEEDFGGARQDAIGVETGGDQGLALIGWDPAHPLQGQHATCGAPPVHLRHPKALVSSEILGQLRGGGGLKPQIHLPPGPGGESVDRRDRPEPAEARLHPLQPHGDAGEEVEIARHPPLDARAQDLDRDLLAGAGHGEMDLGDRGGCDRAIIEFREQLIEGLTERVLDRPAGERAVERWQVVLQLRQVGGHLLAEQIRARGEALAELDEAGPKVLQRQREALSRSARGILARQPAAKAQHDVRERQTLQRKESVVPGQATRDPDQPPKVPQVAQHDGRAYSLQAECIAAMPPDRSR